MDGRLMTTRNGLIALLAIFLVPLIGARADQILPPPQIDGSGNLKFRGGPTLGTYSGGKYISTPQALTLPSADQGSTGDISGLSVKLGNLARRMDQKLTDSAISVEDYRGGACAGAADDTCAIKAAVATACARPSASIILPALAYTISDTISIGVDSTCNVTALSGKSGQLSTITMTALNKPAIKASGVGHKFQNLIIKYSSFATSGGIGVYLLNTTRASLENVWVQSAYISVKVEGAGDTYLNNIHLDNHTVVGLWIENVIDVYTVNSVITATADKATLGNIRIYNHAEGIYFVNGDCIGGVYSMTIDAASNVDRQRPSYNGFVNMQFDTSQNGIFINNAVMIDFVGGWISSHQNNGIVLGNTDSISLSAGVKVYNNGRSGVQLSSSAKHTLINGNHIMNNGFIAPGTLYGVEVLGASDFTITSNNMGAYPGATTPQAFCVALLGSGYDRYTIFGNLCTGNSASNRPYVGTPGPNSFVNGNW